MQNSHDLATELYKKFSQVDGNQHIASLYALEKIIDIIKVNQPKSILEIGLGIGSISDTILEYATRGNISIEYFGTELNDFCLGELPKNLGEHYSKINLFDDLASVPDNRKYDFVIVDGSDEALESIKGIISENGVIFIEGDRTFQEERLRPIFPKSIYVQIISDFRNPGYGPFPAHRWCGGGKLIYVNPTFGQRLHHFRERLKTAYRYKFVRK